MNLIRFLYLVGNKETKQNQPIILLNESNYFQMQKTPADYKTPLKNFFSKLTPLKSYKIQDTGEHVRNLLLFISNFIFVFSKKTPLDFEQFQQRVATFAIETWYGKPYEINPLVCSRFGFVNNSDDLITCQNCRKGLKKKKKKN